jgi:hypothetical protein
MRQKKTYRRCGVRLGVGNVVTLRMKLMPACGAERGHGSFKFLSCWKEGKAIIRDFPGIAISTHANHLLITNLNALDCP